MKKKKQIVKPRNAAHTLNQKGGPLLNERDKKKASSRRKSKAKLRRGVYD
jgi:hypothetical protein